MAFEHTETNLPLENEYPKLVRDLIPQRIKDNDDLDVPVRILSDDQEYLSYLLKKVAEEAEELSQAQTDANIQEEIADVYELIDAISKLKHWSVADLQAVQADKRAKRGGFDGRLLMLEDVAK